MRELLGWICCGISGICLIGIFVIQMRNPPDMNKPLALREMEADIKVVGNPVGCLLVLLGCGFGFLGMWLIGMFGRQ
jgi:hypothetical protein